MICPSCAIAAQAQKFTGCTPDQYPKVANIRHPKNCGCACQHRPVGSVKFDIKEKK